MHRVKPFLQTPSASSHRLRCSGNCSPCSSRSDPNANALLKAINPFLPTLSDSRYQRYITLKPKTRPHLTASSPRCNTQAPLPRDWDEAHSCRCAVRQRGKTVHCCYTSQSLACRCSRKIEGNLQRALTQRTNNRNALLHPGLISQIGYADRRYS